MFSPSAVTLAITALLLLTAVFFIFLLSLNAICELTLRGLQLYCALCRGFDVRSTAKAIRTGERECFVSVHVATHNEPPELVIATLASLARSRYSRFEVIILDNNTHDPKLWQPVARAAAQLGKRFRFVHLDGVKDAKAGALNEALRRSDPRTTQVAVVDADYQVTPDFLGEAIGALLGSGVDYVQFPQAYRGVSPHAIGVERELGDYFTSFAMDAGRTTSMLPTGTLSMFDVRALRAIGGWSGSSITEDAEIGVRLQAAGYRGIWVGCESGQGLLPLDFRGLRMQRARWAAGNFQVLRRVLAGSPLPLSRTEWMKLVVQLTAWLSLWSLPALALAAGIVPRLPFASLISGIAAITICGSAALTALRMALVGRDGCADPAYVPALATKLSLTWTSATAWFPALLGSPLVFKRTPKFISRSELPAEAGLALVSFGYALLAVLYGARLQPLELLACGLLASVWPCAAVVDRNLKASALLNPELELA